ncbi:hypothetical protein BTH95_03575 [Lactobacillus delbrueckii subsp. bulgaricus]|nr:hypothetical protein [Lactobacillus delbrueckii subsp. bulgaricus]MBT8825002.1 hypothetical protein [Lactobacillus delbrueckii subsp. bulgaricus]MBT8841184.1 hypothetical protein [Lactobacillus delbrueckii subsp. bulgaricus]MBT8845865.1 hypothetical protein [Lactobacillus delbrueckii subsp. bulgaricus]
MSKYKVIHDFWGKKEHRYYFKDQTIDVDDDERAEQLLAVHPSVGTPLITATKRTAKKKEEVTSDETVSDEK